MIRGLAPGSAVAYIMGLIVIDVSHSIGEVRLDEWLSKATQGVDMDAPDAFWHIFWNLMAMVPWAAMFWWSVVFLVVGALLGWWRGRLWEGVVWAAVLGPFGWVVILFRPRPKPRQEPPPLPR